MPLIRMLFALLVWMLPAFAEAPLFVEFVAAEVSEEKQYFSLTGEVLAEDTLSASFPISGRIAQVFVEEGGAVKAGSPLARMEAVQQEQALRSTEAGLATAEVDYLQAIEDLNRQTSLLERGATTKILRDGAEDALNIARGARDQAQATLDRARKALEDTVLLAPKDGVVIERFVDAGEVVGPAQSVMTLALGEGLDAVFEVPEVLLARSGSSSEIELVLIEYPDLPFTGMVSEVSPLVDSKTGTVSVRVSIIDAPTAASYGDAIRGTATSEGVPHISLPHSAMSVTVDGPAVWVVDPDTMAVSLRQILVDRYETGRIILVGGLEEGTLVVSRGAHLLYPGRIVQKVEKSQ